MMREALLAAVLAALAALGVAQVAGTQSSSFSAVIVGSDLIPVYAGADRSGDRSAYVPGREQPDSSSAPSNSSRVQR